MPWRGVASLVLSSSLSDNAVLYHRRGASRQRRWVTSKQHRTRTRVRRRAGSPRRSANRAATKPLSRFPAGNLGKALRTGDGSQPGDGDGALSRTSVPCLIAHRASPLKMESRAVSTNACRRGGSFSISSRRRVIFRLGFLAAFWGSRGPPACFPVSQRRARHSGHCSDEWLV